MGPTRPLVVAVVVAAASASSRAFALGANGQPIDTSDYTIDVYEGPNLANARLVGLAGAYGPLAVGVQGFAYNPSSVVARDPWSVSWFDWEIDAGLTLPASVTDFDFDNNGDDSFANEAALFGMIGGRLHFGDFAIGASIDASFYDVRSKTSDQNLDVTIARGLLVAGYSFFEGEILAGLGVSANVINLNDTTTETTTALASVAGAAVHVGAKWQPLSLPIQVGASVRLSPPASWLPDSAPENVEKDRRGNYVSEGYVLPRVISLPTEVYAAVGLQLFRPMNFRWVNPRLEPSEAARVRAAIETERAERRTAHEASVARAKKDGASDGAVEAREAAFDLDEEAREEADSERIDEATEKDRQRRLVPYRTMPREKLLIVAGAKITTITTNGVGIESFLRQVVERSGEQVSVSPRLGLESEVVPSYLVIRGGSYIEPTRFRTSEYRPHGTFGFDVRIPVEWSVFGLFEDDNTFRIGGAIDGAPRYFGWGVSAGVWR